MLYYTRVRNTERKEIGGRWDRDGEREEVVYRLKERGWGTESEREGGRWGQRGRERGEGDRERYIER